MYSFLEINRDMTQLSPVLMSRRCSVSETMVEAAGFSTTGLQPQPTTHALPSHPMPTFQQHCHHHHMGEGVDSSKVTWR